VNDLNPSNDNGEFHGFPIASPNRIIPFECIISFGHQGRGRVESFTVHHNRDSVPFRGVVIGRLEGVQIEKHNCSCSLACLKANDHLPRQARDKHKEDMC
jgi:hypothetical protein